MEIWDDPDSVADGSDDAKALAFAREYLDCKKAAETARANAQEALERLLSFFPEEFGELRRSVGDNSNVIDRGGRVEWDTDILEAMYATKSLPHHITQRLSIAKRKWGRLDEQHKAELMPELTRKLGLPKIRIEPV